MKLFRSTFFSTCLFLSTLLCQTSSAQVVRFATNLGNIDVQLLPGVAPKTVANFLAYMNAGTYNNSLVHRAVPGFIWQGGSFQLINNTIYAVQTNAAIANEFKISNTRGTLAMALASGDANSATSGWFFNEADNSATLDPSSFTVFGTITNSAGLAVMDAIAAVPIYALNQYFTQIPLMNYSGTFHDSNLVLVQSITTLVPAGPAVGFIDTPADNSANLAGGIAVTGWALSYAGLSSLGIYRDPLPNEPTQSNGLVFLGNAEFLPGARPDIAHDFPNYPNNTAAGWGFQLLSNELPGTSGHAIGNGTYTLHAIATNTTGATTELGTKTISVSNATSNLPFGTIDTPTQGGVASGTAFINFGWALTPQPDVIPFDGSTITVYVDNNPLGHPVYNNPRSDIQTLFPGYQNTNGAVGYFSIDTTQLTNGVHNIAWLVVDNAGHTSGIGSRFFTVQN